MTETTESTVIVTEMKTSTLFRVRFALPICIFAAIEAANVVWLVFDLLSAMQRHSVMIVFYPLLHGVFFILGMYFIIALSKIIIQAAKNKSVIKTVLYADTMLMLNSTKNMCTEEIYRCADFTRNREKRNYFFLSAPNVASNVISKRDLSAAELNTIRRLFGLPVKDGGEINLPAYDGEPGISLQIKSISTDAKRKAIKTSFCGYYSRDKIMLRPQIIASSIGLAIAFIGLIFSAACYCASDAVWAAACTVLSVGALFSFALWLIDTVSTVKRSKKTTDSGTVNEYVIFADKTIVYTCTQNTFGITVIPYEDIARVRETNDDIWIDYPKGSTYVIVKRMLTQIEYMTVLKLLKRNSDTKGTLELDPAPEIDLENP